MAAPSAQARLTLQDAFERFASTVAPDDKRLFHNTQLKDVRDEAMRIERQLRARRTQKNMARLDPFLRGMEHYSKVVEVLCNGTPFLPWIWAPVKLMLTVSRMHWHRACYSLWSTDHGRFHRCIRKADRSIRQDRGHASSPGPSRRCTCPRPQLSERAGSGLL
jgi:hypothetical protein